MYGGEACFNEKTFKAEIKFDCQTLDNLRDPYFYKKKSKGFIKLSTAMTINLKNCSTKNMQTY